MDVIFISVLAIVAGYAAALVVSLAVTFGAAYFARPLLVSEGIPLWGYQVTTTLSWLLGVFSACSIAMLLAPSQQGLYLVGMAALMALLLAGVMREVRVQQPSVTIGCSAVGLVMGAVLAWAVVPR